MNCPVCRKPIIVLEVDRVEVDHCVHCGGVWLDGGELELLLDGAANRDELLAAMTPAEADEQSRLCPICGKQMQKVRCGGEVVDRCSRGHGLWFDAGELNTVTAQGHFPGENRIQSLLIDVFGGE